MKSPRLSAIVAMSENRVIGYKNQLPWHLSADLKHFKSITMGHPILMGRKTHESIGKALPGRTNLILTHNSSFQAPGCVVVTSLNRAMEEAMLIGSNEIFIIGGSEIFKQLLPNTTRLYLTIVHANVVGDAFFPELDLAIWRELEKTSHPADAENEYGYSFILLEKV